MSISIFLHFSSDLRAQKSRQLKTNCRNQCFILAILISKVSRADTHRNSDMTDIAPEDQQHSKILRLSISIKFLREKGIISERKKTKIFFKPFFNRAALTFPDTAHIQTITVRKRRKCLFIFMQIPSSATGCLHLFKSKPDSMLFQTIFIVWSLSRETKRITEQNKQTSQKSKQTHTEPPPQKKAEYSSEMNY